MKVEFGKLLEDGTFHRDAVHVPVIAVVAGEDLSGGTHVGVTNREKYIVGTEAKTMIGIVDPFLPGVGRGQTFWLLLYPNSNLNLRHAWDHPDFSDNENDREYYDDPCAGCW